MLLTIQLGELYRDQLTGFIGYATAEYVHIDGEHDIHLENHHDSRWIKFKRLETLPEDQRPLYKP